MIFYDKNQTLEPPVGFELQEVSADGSYLQLTYVKRDPKSESTIVVYLNDQGREVGRSISEYVFPILEPARTVAPVAKKFRFWNGVLLIQEGIQEVLKCLKRS